jgi:hypothetical protein
MVMQHVVVARSHRSRQSRFRPAYYIPFALFTVSIVGGLAVVAAELPVGFF